MDNDRFDALTRVLGNGGTRRGLMRGAAGSALAWLGLTRSSSRASSQEASDSEIAFAVQPICTCPEGLMLCQGLCVRPRDCEQEPGAAVASEGVSGNAAEGEADESAQPGETVCPPQEKLCPAKGICVPCPTTMSLDRDCKCTCRNTPDTRCNATCDCPKIASCDCVCPGPPCKLPKLQHARTCECICPKHRSCPAGKVFDDRISCTCICPDHAPCPSGTAFDEKTCSCVCPVGRQLCREQCVTCPPGARLDARCNCRCPSGKNLCGGKCVDACQTSQPLDPITCQCGGCPKGKTRCKEQCVELCPPGSRLNLDTCACVCLYLTCGATCCEEGQVCNATVDPPQCCTPHNTCPLLGHCGFVPDNCGGALDLGPCPDEVCHSVYCQPGDLCNACVYTEVPNGERGPLCDAAGEICCGGACCGSGKICQNGVCCAPNGVCPCVRTCPPGQLLDPATCTCGRCPNKGMTRCQGKCVECPAESCCLDPTTCKCACPDCGAIGAFDPVTCGCVCGPTVAAIECPPNWFFDEPSCSCVCPPSPCAPGSNWQFDQERCTCVCNPPSSCPPNFVFNEESCSCVCPMTECSPNHVWDLEACTCTCVPQECPDYFVFDESLCGCVCGRGGCPPNYVFDEANCACLCAAECPPTFVFDEATCSCLCQLDGCPPNLTFTPESCACYCAPPACPPGYFVDQASCTCFCAETACGEGHTESG